MIVDKINAYLNDPKEVPEEILANVAELAKWTFSRQFGNKEETERTLRLSSIGQCLRKQAYNVLGYEINGKEIDPRAKMVFFQGDMAELAIIQLALLAGCKITRCGKDQVEVIIDGVPGHPDGILETPLENYLVEVKSMSSYGFAEFEAGGIDEAYLYQINGYMYPLGLKKCIVVALNKDAGVMCERIIEANDDIQTQIMSNIKRLKWVRKENLPEQKFKPNEKGILPWQCCYCAHWKTCRPNAEIKLIGKSNKLVESKKESA